MKRKKILSVILAMATAAAMSANMLAYAETPGHLYVLNESIPADMYYIIGIEGNPISRYPQAKEMGVRDFILTEEGNEAFEAIMLQHDEVKAGIAELIGREPKVAYDYTSAYNGLCVELSSDEVTMIAENMDKLNIMNIEFGAENLGNTSKVETENKRKENTSYEDITEKIFEATGITESGLDGEGIVVAMIDSEFDREHEFFKTPSEFSATLSKSDIRAVYPYLSASPYVSDKCYGSEKVPYTFNYQNLSYNTYTNNDYYIHGSHVAGIAVGSEEHETLEKYNPKGVAPNAQFVALTTNMLYDACILAAYDDVLYLGADVVNASYGYEGAALNPSFSEYSAITNIVNTGVVFSAAAGNSAKYLPYENLFTDYSISGTPDNVDNGISVASADNIALEKKLSKIVMAYGTEENIVDGSIEIADIYDGYTLEYVVVPGEGTEEDYENIDVTKKIALVERGSLTFDDKAFNALSAGAVGMIIYNNVDDEPISPATDMIPTGMVSKQAGQKLINAETKKITFKKSEAIVAIDENINISSYSSWDFTEQLLLKPDITTFGGSIISSVPDEKNTHKSYEFFSGTSMAAPQFTGLAALLKQHIKKYPEKYVIEKESDYAELIAKLFMSTATPVLTSDKLEIASPRVQGNGLANINDAINTPCYISTNSEKDLCRPKLSLGDGYNQVLKLDFNVTNISDKTAVYNLSANVFKDEADENGNLAANTFRLTDGKEYTVSFTDETGKKIDKISVSAGTTSKLTATVKLSDKVFNKIKTDGGRFVDGFVTLSSTENPNLTLSFMTFCGDWATAETNRVIDEFIYDNEEPYYTSCLSDGYNVAGLNMFDYVVTAPTFSPSNNDGVLDDMFVEFVAQRRGYNLTAKIYNAKNEVVYNEKISDTIDYVADYNGYYSSIPVGWDFKENGTVKNNAEYTIELSATMPFATKSTVIGKTKFIIDNEKPVVEKVGKITAGDSEYLIINAKDNVDIQCALLYSEIWDILSIQSVNSSISGDNIIIDITDATEYEFIELYDTAGNYTVIDIDDAAYNLTAYGLDGNILAYADDEDFVSDDISLIDKDGNPVDLEISCDITPSYVADELGNYTETEALFFVDGFDFTVLPVMTGIRGDANLDGKCNVRDAAYLANLMSRKTSEEYENFMSNNLLKYADFNEDDNVNIRDAAGIAASLAANY